MKKFVVFIMLFTSLILIDLSVNAAETEDIDNYLNFCRNEIEHKTSSSAICISTNSIGDIAIAFNDDSINIYDQNGCFKYSFSFEVDGTYTFEFDNQDNLMILPARGDNSYYFNTDAELLQKKAVSLSIDRTRYVNKILSKDSIIFEKCKYALTQPFGYTKLIRIDENGNETIIYDIGTYYIAKILCVVGLICILLLFCGLMIKSTTKHNNI